MVVPRNRLLLPKRRRRRKRREEEEARLRKRRRCVLVVIVEREEEEERFIAGSLSDLPRTNSQAHSSLTLSSYTIFLFFVSQVSARGKLIQEQLRKQREAQEAAEAAAEAERQRIAAEEAAEEARLAAIAAEKQRKKQEQQERIAQMKRDGTYKTKKQLEKERQAALRLEQMRAAGMVVPDRGEDNGKPKRIVYDNKKKRGKGRGGGQRPSAEESSPTEKEEIAVEPTPEIADKSSEPAKTEDAVASTVDDEEEDWEKEDEEEKEDKEESSGDEWDADSDDEDGDGDKFGDLEKRLQMANEADEEVDMIAIEKKKEQERLKELGRKRAEQERLEAARLEKLRLEQEEKDLKEAMAAQLREEGRRKRMEQEKANLAARSPDDLRCPIVVIMGHVRVFKCCVQWVHFSPGVLFCRSIRVKRNCWTKSEKQTSKREKQAVSHNRLGPHFLRRRLLKPRPLD